MPSELRKIHVLVTGRVQGVGYRAYVQANALQLGIQGWVRNLPTGTVELVAQGPASLIAELEDTLWAGPPLSKVADLHIESSPPDPDLKGFAIRH
jgi:acylphosphatase